MKSHYQSKNAAKLMVVLDVYRGLAQIPEIHEKVVAKVVSMLLTPFASVRCAAADTMNEVHALKEMEQVNWAAEPKMLKSKVEGIRKLLQ